MCSLHKIPVNGGTRPCLISGEGSQATRREEEGERGMGGGTWSAPRLLNYKKHLMDIL